MNTNIVSFWISFPIQVGSFCFSRFIMLSEVALSDIVAHQSDDKLCAIHRLHTQVRVSIQNDVVIFAVYCRVVLVTWLIARMALNSSNIFTKFKIWKFIITNCFSKSNSKQYFSSIVKTKNAEISILIICMRVLLLLPCWFGSQFFFSLLKI